jgi:hypothetical protein
MDRRIINAITAFIFYFILTLKSLALAVTDNDNNNKFINNQSSKSKLIGSSIISTQALIIYTIITIIEITGNRINR